MKDLILLSLIISAEADPPMEQDVTLLVGGFLVSGFVISYDKYVQHHETIATIESAIQKVKAENPEPTEKTTNFIHLRDAKYYTPGGAPIPGNTGVFVRLSLESIRGFTLGSLVAEPA